MKNCLLSKEGLKNCNLFKKTRIASNIAIIHLRHKTSENCSVPASGLSYQISHLRSFLTGQQSYALQILVPSLKPSFLTVYIINKYFLFLSKGLQRFKRDYLVSFRLEYYPGIYNFKNYLLRFIRDIKSGLNRFV